jgi:hypothetical protein
VRSKGRHDCQPHPPASHARRAPSPPETTLAWEELNRLPQGPERIDEWQGVVRCVREEVGEEQRARLRGCCVVAGPVFLFGDPDLLKRIAKALDGAKQR